MILPTTMDWDEAVAATDEELVDAYVSDGMDAQQAQAYAAEIRAAVADPSHIS